MRVKCVIIHVILDCILLYMYVKGYLFGIKFFNQIFCFHVWFVDILYGIFGIAYVIALANFISPVVFTLLKSIDLYALSNEDCNTFPSAIAGVTSKFTSTVAIVTFNKIIRTCIEEISSRVEAGELTSEFFDSISSYSFLNKSVKFAKSIMTTAFDYVDECVLAYCYSHDTSVGKAAVYSISKFMGNIGNVGLKTVSLVITEKLVIFLYTVIYLVCVIKNLKWSLLFFVEAYVIYCAIRYVIRDGILEPFFRDTIVKQFLASLPEDNSADGDTESNTVDDSSYSMEDVKNFTEGKEETKGTEDVELEDLPASVKELIGSVPTLKKLLNYK